MTQYLNPFSGRQFLDANGAPYSGAKLFTYVAGSSTKVTTAKDSAGTSSHANPIILNTKGEPADAGGAAQAIWQVGGAAIKLVLAPSNDTDPPASPIATWDNLTGINDTSVSIDQWVSGPTPTYVSATSFTLVGDQTSTFHVGRRVNTTNSGGTVYGTITASAYATLTTVTVSNDSGSIDSGLSAVYYGLLTSSYPSVPGVKMSGSDWTHQGTLTMSGKSIWFAEGADVASAGTTNIWTTDGNTVHVTGTTTITSFGTAPQAGATKRVIFDGALTLTHGANLNLPGAANITTAAGDSCIVYADSTTQLDVFDYTRAAGTPVIGTLTAGTSTASTSGTTISYGSIPSWVKRITFMLSGVSTNGTSGIELTIGDSGGIETSGYLGAISRIGAATVATANHPTDAFTIVNDLAAADILHGIITLTLVDSASFTWAINGGVSESNSTSQFLSSGSKALSAALTTVQLQTTNGTDAFDAGVVNILYE